LRKLPAAFLLTLLLAGPAAAGTVKVYYPPDYTIVEESVLTVEGSVTDPSLEEFDVIAGEEERYQAYVRDFLFSVEVDLVPGANRVQIGEDVLHVFYSFEGETAPAEYHPVYGHIGLDDGCAECHQISDGGKLSFDESPDEVCGWCHGDLVRSRGGEDLASVHGPVRAGKCLLCHTPHLSDQPGLPLKTMPECRECHQETFERLETERYVHGPLNLGDCRLCHTIHSSKQQSLLVDSPLTICPQCHFDVEVKPDTPEDLRPHVLIPQGLCGRCHFPHSSDHPKMMREPAVRICLSCHPKNTRSFHEKKGFSIYVCQKCHDLHRPTMPHLIIDNSRSLCLQCHEFRKDAAFTHEFIKEGGCFICHTFHSAPLADDIAVICLKCHGDNPRLGEAHGEIDIGKASCSGCHSPHQSDREKLLYSTEHTPFRERDCAACHDKRAALMKEQKADLCISCHKDKDMAAAEKAGREVHPPAEEEDCSFCHRSHTSAEPGLLREPELQICLSCHRKLKKVTIMKPRSSHDFVLKGECHRCHEPHSSDQASFLLKPRGELCTGCHGELLTAPDGSAWTSSHPPVEEAKCKLCHKPHTSRKPSLLRDGLPQACRPCHQKFFSMLGEAGEAKTHKPVREGECASCHDVHGSEVRALLSEGDVGKLCKSCHESPPGGHHL
jgi:predicted CXXCH cytochrome family protein